MNAFGFIRLSCVSEVIAAKDTAACFVMVFPFFLVLVVVQLLTEGGKSAADTHQTIGCRIAVFARHVRTNQGTCGAIGLGALFQVV